MRLTWLAEPIAIIGIGCRFPARGLSRQLLVLAARGRTRHCAGLTQLVAELARVRVGQVTSLATSATFVCFPPDIDRFDALFFGMRRAKHWMTRSSDALEVWESRSKTPPSPR